MTIYNWWLFTIDLLNTRLQILLLHCASERKINMINLGLPWAFNIVPDHLICFLSLFLKEMECGNTKQQEFSGVYCASSEVSKQRKEGSVSQIPLVPLSPPFLKPAWEQPSNHYSQGLLRDCKGFPLSTAAWIYLVFRDSATFMNSFWEDWMEISSNFHQ